MKIVIIAAMDKNQTIGFRGDIPWYIPEEIEHFESSIKDEVIICGRKTFETIPVNLRNRNTIVLTRGSFLNGCTVASDMLDAIRKAKILLKAQNKPMRVFVIGGEETYQHAAGMADELILSYVDGYYKGDTFFPQVYYQKWKAVDVKKFNEFKVITWRRR